MTFWLFSLCLAYMEITFIVVSLDEFLVEEHPKAGPTRGKGIERGKHTKMIQ